jgi:hypothetical protein
MGTIQRTSFAAILVFSLTPLMIARGNRTREDLLKAMDGTSWQGRLHRPFPRATCAVACSQALARGLSPHGFDPKTEGVLR